MARIFYILILLTATYAQPNDFVTTFQYGLEEYVLTGGYTRRLDDALQLLYFPKLFRAPYSNQQVLNNIICLTCQASMNVLLTAKRIGIDDAFIKDTIIMLCVKMKIESEQVCRGVIEIHYKTIAFIVQQRDNIDAERMCGIIFQYKGCVDTKRVNWQIKIPEREQIVRKKKVQSKSAPLKILHLTDIHYNPEYQVGSNAACQDPLCCLNGTFPSTEENGAGQWGDYRNCDTPWRVLVSSISHILTQHEKIDYIYFTGDIVDHKVWDTSVESNSKSILNVLYLLKATFRSTPIFPILGNHETHPVNVFSPNEITGELSTQWIFNLMKSQWRKWLPNNIQGTVSKGGYYTVLVKEGFRIVALNSNVCFSFNWWLLYDDVDPYDQLNWLVLVLHKAERNNETVHILSHVPSADSTCLQNWSREFSKIILRFSHIIAGQFNGHTHAKEDIIYYEGNDLSKPVNIAFNGGSLTPYSNYNPNYVVYDIDRNTFEVTDYDVWTYDIAHSNMAPNRLPHWFKLYSFTKAYKIDRISPHHLSDLVVNMTKDCNLANQYFRFKYRDASVSVSKGCNRDCVRENVCYMVTQYYNHLDQCNILQESVDASYNC